MTCSQHCEAMSSIRASISALQTGPAPPAAGRLLPDAVAAGSETPEVVAKNPKLGERVAASPAIADHTLCIRTAGHWYAFAEQK
jgi:hypothetical protein